MTDQEFARLASAEERMWYFRALREHLWRHLRPLAEGGQPCRVLDAGCGTGGWLRDLQTRTPHWELHGVDISEVALAWARKKEGGVPAAKPLSYRQGDLTQLPFASGSFDAVTCPDVLCLLPDVPAAIEEMVRVLRPGGVFVATAPAYRWLRSYHDEQVGGRHRFLRKEWPAMAQRAGLLELYSSYWNTLTFPAIVWQRKIAGAPVGGDVQLRSPWQESLLQGMMSVECALLDRGGAWPFGASLIFAGRKAGTRELAPARQS